MATYRVADVTTLTLSPTPEPPNTMSAGGANALEPANSEADTPLTFGFEPAAGDSPAQLTVMVPPLLAGAEDPTNVGTPLNPVDPAEFEQARELFRGMRVSMAVRVAGEVVETNASRHDAAPSNDVLEPQRRVFSGHREEELGGGERVRERVVRVVGREAMRLT